MKLPQLPFGRVYFCAMLLILTGVSDAAEISFLFIGETDTAAYLGAGQGLREANAQGEFLGTSYRLTSEATKGPDNRSIVAIVAAVNPTRLARIVEENSDLPIFNIAAAEASVRENCEPNLFHINPSSTMLADAVRQWRRNNPSSRAHARTWHKSFRKYAAGQLNIRFKEHTGQVMDDDSWAGWAAIKLLADTIVRQPSLHGALLIEELKTNVAFDGQKGMDMGFRETGQLRQPLLLIEDDKIVGEAPVRGVVDTTDLDSLGIEFCAK